MFWIRSIYFLPTVVASVKGIFPHYTCQTHSLKQRRVYIWYGDETNKCIQIFRVSSYIYMFQPQFNYPQGGPLQGLYYKNVFKPMHKSKIRANLISISRYLLCIILTTVSSTCQLYNFIRITFYTRILLSFHDGEILHNSYMEFTTKILSVLYILIFISNHAL